MSTRTTLQEVEEAWDILMASGDGPAKGWMSRTASWTYRGQPLGLARDGEGRRHLLVPIDPGDPFKSDTESSGVQMLDRVLLEGSSPRRYVDLVCSKEHLEGVFSHLIVEVIEALQKPGRADQSIRGVLQRWRELLARGPAHRIPEGVLTGLFAELVVLAELAEVSPTAEEGWVGPEGGRHDFVLPEGSIEVKGSRGRHGRRMEIHGLDQLEPPDSGLLYLAFVAIEADPRGRSVKDLITELEALGCRRERFDQALMRLGLVVGQDRELVDSCFSVRERLSYLVDEQFPRITHHSFSGGTLPAGVISVSYQIDLTGDAPAPRSPEVWSQDLTRLLGGFK